VDSAGYVIQDTADGADWLVVQAGNHETGSVDDLQALGKSARLLVDASEWAGRMESSPGGNIIITRASSWGGPVSVCFVVFADSPPSLTPQKRQKLSPDPVLTALAVSALEQCGDVAARGRVQAETLETLGGQLAKVEGITVHADFDRPRLPHLLTFSVAGIDAEALCIELDRQGFAVGAGSACLSENSQSSHVLAAMGVESSGGIRLSLPLSATAADLEAFGAAIGDAIDAVR
jgi:cysteine desulfurase